MNQRIADFANETGLNAASIESLFLFIADRVGDKVNEENVQDILEAYIPQWLAAQDRLATEALTKFPQFCGVIYDMIRAEA